MFERMDNMTTEEQEKYWQTLCGLSGEIKNLNDERRVLLKTIKYPSSLFRFLSVNEDSLQALQENQVYFSSADHYDDPFDTYLRVDIQSIKNEFEMLKKGNNLSNAMAELSKAFQQLSVGKDIFKDIQIDYNSIKYYVKQLRNFFQKNLYSICFCEDVRNEVLWLKYAENHKGFVLEYEIVESILDNLWKSCNANILPMYYSDNKYNAYRYFVYNITLCFVKDYPEIYDKLQWMHPIGWENTKMSIIKKTCHKYDEEWRIIPLYIMTQREFIRWKPKSVTIGLRTPTDKRNLIVSAAKVAGITEFYEMYVDDNDNFERRPIEIY